MHFLTYWGWLVVLIKTNRCQTPSRSIPFFSVFLNGFGRTMLRVASVRLGISSESQALVTYRAIANVMNRFGEMD